MTDRFNIPADQAEAISAIIKERSKQIERFGHSPEADAKEPLFHLPRVAGSLLQDAIDALMFASPLADDFHETQARALRKITQAGAVCIAAHQRLSTYSPGEKL